MTETGTADRRQQRREAKRAQIIAAAWLLARRDGLGAISLRDLADRVGLRQPSLYVYFASKLDLFDAMFDDAYRRVLDQLRRAPLPRDPKSALIAFATDVVEFANNDPEGHHLLFQRNVPGFEPSATSWALALEFVEIAGERLRAADVDDPAEVDVFSILVAGLAQQQIANDPGGKRYVQHTARIVEMFLADVSRRRRNHRNPKGTR